jgi:hypothetical protein
MFVLYEIFRGLERGRGCGCFGNLGSCRWKEENGRKVDRP